MGKVLVVVDNSDEMFYLQGLLTQVGFHVDGTSHFHMASVLLTSFSPQIVIVKTSKGLKGSLPLIHAAQRMKKPPKLILFHPPRNIQSREQSDTQGEAWGGEQIEARSEAGSQSSSPIVNRVLTSPINSLELLKAISELGPFSLEALREKALEFKTPPWDHEPGEAMVIHGSRQKRREALVIPGASIPKGEALDRNILVDKDHVSLPAPSKKSPEPVADFNSFLSKPEGRREKYKSLLKGQKPLEKKCFSRENVEGLTQTIRELWDEGLETQLQRERQEFVKTLFQEGHKKNMTPR